MTDTALFTTSWDDGHPLDLRLGELLAEHGFRATFYVPLSNSEGQPVMSSQQIRSLGAAFEIGSHTLDHCYLNTVDCGEARRQITDGKSKLEDILGYPVRGFCYPGGAFNRAHRQMTMDTGFAYARTTVNLVGEAPDDPYSMPTTIQFYPHSWMVYLKNFLSKGNWPRRAGLLSDALRSREMMVRLNTMIEHVCTRGGVFHLWGHSWELDSFDGWQQLDVFLRYVAERIPRQYRLTNGELVRKFAPTIG